MTRKFRSMLAVGCLTAGMCIPSAVLGQQVRPMSNGGGAEGLKNVSISHDPVFEFVLMDDSARLTGLTVMYVDGNASENLVANADGVFSLTNPPSEFQLVIERANAAPVTVKMLMPDANTNVVTAVPVRRGPNSDTVSNQQQAPVNDVVRGVVNITDGNPSISILDPGMGFDKAETALLTKSGFVPRPVQAGTGRAGDGCVDATPIACGGTETFTLQAFNAEPVPLTSSCELAVGGPFTHDKSVWFEFTASATTAHISMCVSDSEQDSVMTLFTADSTCGALTEFTCNDDGCPDIVNPNGFGAPDLFVGGLTPGDTYFVLLDFYSGGHDLPDDGTFDVDNTITVECGIALPTGACCANDGTCTEVEEADCVGGGGTYQGDNTLCSGVTCPVLATNETCQSAIVVDAVPFVSAVDNDLSIPNGPAGSCDGFGATGMMQNDIWYEWTADQDCLLDMNVTSTYDSILVVRDNCTDLNELICIDENGFGDGEAGQLSVTNGTTYYFQVGDNGSIETGGLTEFSLSCFENTGACCVGKGCSIETEADCSGMGGTYLGNDTSCDAPPAGTPTTYAGGGGIAIPDNDPTGIEDTINVADSYQVGDVNVSIQVEHTFLGDLDITLTHNGTTSSIIMQDACGTNADMDITIDDAAGDVVCAEPLTGTFNSASLNGEGMGAFNGENSAGTWTLSIVDDAGQDTGSLLSWSLELDGAGAGPCEDLEPACGPDACPDGTRPIVGVENGNFAGWCVSGAPAADVDFFFFRVDKAGDFALIEITKEFTQGPEAPTGLVPPILVTFFQVCDDEDTVGSIIIGEESVRNSTGVDWTDYHWNLFDANEVWFDVAASSNWSTLPFADKEFTSFIDGPANTKAKSLNADNGLVPNNSQYFPGSGTGVLKMDVDLSGPPVNFTFKQRPTIDGTPDPEGACCLVTGCQVLTEADCNSQSGAYQGDGASCTPDPCAEPTGACCNDDGSCSGDLTQNACEGGGGTYQGDSSDCGSVTCPMPSNGDVCTDAVEIFDGLNMGAIVDGGVDDPDPSCTTSGSDDTWFMYTATTAGSLLIETCGTFVDDAIGGSEVDTIVAVYDACGGVELDCDDDCTTGGTDPDAPCKDEDQTGTGGTRDSCVCVDSVNIGDEFWIQVQEFGGNNFDDILVTVTPNGCDGPPPPLGGGCCNSDGSCDDVADQAACDGQGGVYQGDGVACASVSCPQPGNGNDECEDRAVLACDQTTFADLIDATNGAADPAQSCSTTVNPCTEYYEFVPTGTSARIRTDLNSTANDSVYTLYQVDQANPCNEAAWTEVVCSEDEVGLLGDVCADGLTPGDTYVLMITGFAAFRCDDGPYGIDVDCSATCGP